jgi:DNA-binding XRE family transcriptional regulator
MGREIAMIRTDQEYKITQQRLEESSRAMDIERDDMIREGYTPEEIQRGMAPMMSFHLAMLEELQLYERTIAGNMPDGVEFDNLGRLLISLRIKNGWTQKQLAAKLGVAPAQVCRDEKNEYFGISIERAKRILNVLGVQISLKPVAVDKDATVSTDKPDLVVSSPR